MGVLTGRDDNDGVLVLTPTGGLLWHPWPLPPGEDGLPEDPAVWVARLVPGGRWGRAPRPSPGWTPPDPSWGESAPTAPTP